jgi:hypothetical protein
LCGYALSKGNPLYDHCMVTGSLRFTTRHLQNHAPFFIHRFVLSQKQRLTCSYPTSDLRSCRVSNLISSFVEQTAPSFLGIPASGTAPAFEIRSTAKKLKLFSAV